MCGIVGYLGDRDAAPLLFDGLKRLEYRGYDSAGIATLDSGRLERRRAQGKLDNLAKVLSERPMAGSVGIGHTRWATHGAANETNAHPHEAKGIAVVHNGIIENFQALRRRLQDLGHEFQTQTDTEVIPHLVAHYRDQGMEIEAAARQAITELEGAFGLVLLIEDQPGLLIAARKGSPLALGHGEAEMFVGSDAHALAPLTKRIQYLEEGDIAVVTRQGSVITDIAGNLQNRDIVQTSLSGAMIGRGNHRHFMEKEIFEQPAVIGDTLRSFADPATHRINLPDLPLDLANVPRLAAIACGTSAYACMTARYWFEELARLPMDCDLGSEFRYRVPALTPGQLGIFLSQSGETADTMAAMRHMKEQGYPTLAIVNVPESTLARECSAVLRTLAGPEIGVASTKAFTTQLATLACLAIGTARARGTISEQREAEITQALDEIPAHMLQVLEHDEAFKAIAHDVSEARDVLYFGRGSLYPIALEGALKLKEISYIHAEGYAAGELKHGPIALIDEHVPIIVLAPSNMLFDKTASNLMEVKARGGKVVLIGDELAVSELAEHCWHTVTMPKVDPFVAPLLYSIPVQLLAYHTAVAKGTDVDQPRNLAKSVTVE